MGPAETRNRRDNPVSTGLPLLLDRLLVGCLFLFAAFAPHSIAVTQSAWLLGIAFWLSRLAFYPRPLLRKTPLDYFLLGFFILTGLSAFLSYEPLVSIGKLRAASLFTIVYLFAQNVPSRRILRLLVLTLIGSCFINVLFTAGERVVGRGVKVGALKIESPLYAAGVRAGDTILEANGRQVSNPDELANLLIATNPPEGTPRNDSRATIKIYRHEWMPTLKVDRSKLLPGTSAADELGIEAWSKGRDWRAAGFFGHYVTYAEILQLILALTLGLLVSLPVKRSVPGLLLLLGFVGFGFALLLTVTRAPWLAFVISSAVILVLGAKRRVLLTVGLLAIPLVLAGLFVLQQKRNVGFLDSTDGSTTWRQTVWREGFEVLISKPRHLLIGVGMDSIKAHWREWGMFDGGRIPLGHLHSNLLQLAFERGVPALLLWLLLLGAYARLLWKLHRRLKTTGSEQSSTVLSEWIDRGLVLGALGGLAGFFASGLVHYNWGDSEVIMIFYLVMGLALALHALTGDDGRQPMSK